MQYIHKAQPTAQLMWDVEAERSSAEWGYCGEKEALLSLYPHRILKKKKKGRNTALWYLQWCEDRKRVV